MKTKFIALKLTLALALPALSQAAPAKPLELKAEPNRGSVTFLAVGRPSMLKVHGKAPGPEGTLALIDNKLSGRAEFDLNQLDTGIGLRNEHMKKYLETGTHPRAAFTLPPTAVSADFGQSLSQAEGAFSGTMLLHGREQPVQGTYRIEAGIVTAKFPLRLTAHGIEIPTYLGVTLKDEVEVTVALALKKE